MSLVPLDGIPIVFRDFFFIQVDLSSDLISQQAMFWYVFVHHALWYNLWREDNAWWMPHLDDRC